ncbi:UDP-N-acetyl glucosamine 2-epimerase [Kitasatospora indigofera]|uniref:UDP-N-acetylglucosamine 2-epimerase (non-hydrolyzing) n=1 Tax=Kitasatospora indigofera TaxID=67307 RepID=A0A918YUU6_9ACTN|nr:UDP-N-acetylglucosamine 2-epimerase (non-hydrolyzing) [Kitasatospora indigofera]GHE25267.1 UDP-N-acetyl glucosamine 2-epimerase [Kitasatospora indigofera]
MTSRITHVRDRIACIVGTRPEAVKMAPVVLELRKQPWADPMIVTTGQHGPVVTEVLDCFGLRADITLTPPRPGHSLPALTAKLLHEIDNCFRASPWQAVLVQGDTTSALAGAMAGFLSALPVVHVEAGLRSGDLRSPFPEEAHRRMIAQVSALHLAPTPAARTNLRKDGLPGETTVVTGNTVIDAVLQAGRTPAASRDLLVRRTEELGAPLVVVTAHRRENWGPPIARICRAVAELSRRHPELTFLVAAHMNPAVRKPVEAALSALPNVLLPGPVAYAPFSRLLSRARLVITDSGGIQEEAAAFALPVLVTRENTERLEGLQQRVARLVGTREADILAAAEDELARDHDRTGVQQPPQARPNPYGDGHASERCATACGWMLGHTDRPPDWHPEPLHRIGEPEAHTPAPDAPASACEAHVG